MNAYTLEKDQTYQAVITVAEIRPPNGRGKSYALISEEGHEFSIWPDKIGLIRSGEQYEVQISDKESNGRVYHNITGTPRHLGPYRPPKEAPSTLPELPKQLPASNGPKKMDQQYWTPKPRNPAEQKQIFVCALLSREIEVLGESHRAFMTKEEMLARAAIHADVWDALFAEAIARE
jgi:hypothetical protein